MGKWEGAEARKARIYWKSRLPQPCCRCGRVVTHQEGVRGGGWDVDHWPVSREMGGTETWPAHASCNRSAGGKRRAELTNNARAAKTIETNERLGEGLRW